MFNSTKRRIVSLIAVVWAVVWAVVTAGLAIADGLPSEAVGVWVMLGFAPCLAVFGVLWVTAIRKENS